MQRLVHMLQRTAPLWILWIACAGTAQAQSPKTTSEGTLHVILACDVDDPELGEGFEINEGVVRQQFFDTVATRNLRYYAPWNSGAFDSRPKLTAENLLAEIDNIELQPNDTLMVYLACHGFWDKDDGQQWFRFEAKNQ